MKTMSTMVFMALVAAASAQTSPIASSFLTELPPGEFTLEVRPQTPNEVTIKGVTYDGIAVQLFTTTQPFQLLSPFAPESYGDGEQNVERDPITGEVVGLKLFSINF